jgi:peptide/nickel transport system permease protein
MNYLVRRTLLGLFVALGSVFLVTLVLHYTPGDPARILLGEQATEEALASLRHELGLDRPLLVQFLNYLGGVVRGDLGRSFRSGRRVSEEIANAYLPSLKLALTGLATGLLIGISSGVIAALRRGTWIDTALVGGSTLGISFPVFVQVCSSSMSSHSCWTGSRPEVMRG